MDGKISPEDKARLDAMGHDRLMADLAKKFPQTKPPEPESSYIRAQEDQDRQQGTF